MNVRSFQTRCHSALCAQLQLACASTESGPTSVDSPRFGFSFSPHCEYPINRSRSVSRTVTLPPKLSKSPRSVATERSTPETALSMRKWL